MQAPGSAASRRCAVRRCCPARGSGARALLLGPCGAASRAVCRPRSRDAARPCGAGRPGGPADRSGHELARRRPGRRAPCDSFGSRRDRGRQGICGAVSRGGARGPRCRGAAQRRSVPRHRGRSRGPGAGRARAVRAGRCQDNPKRSRVNAPDAPPGERRARPRPPRQTCLHRGLGAGGARAAGGRRRCDDLTPATTHGLAAWSRVARRRIDCRTAGDGWQADRRASSALGSGRRSRSGLGRFPWRAPRSSAAACRRRRDLRRCRLWTAATRGGHDRTAPCRVARPCRRRHPDPVRAWRCALGCSYVGRTVRLVPRGRGSSQRARGPVPQAIAGGSADAEAVGTLRAGDGRRDRSRLPCRGHRRGRRR